MVQPRRPQVTRGLPMQQRPSAMMQAPAQPTAPARMAAFSQRSVTPSQPMAQQAAPSRMSFGAPRVAQPQAMAAVPSQVRQQTQAPQISSYVQQQAQPRQQMQRIQQNQMSAYGQPQPYMDTRGGIPPAWLSGQSGGQPQQPQPYTGPSTDGRYTNPSSGGFVMPPRTDLRPSTNPDGSPIGTGNGMPGRGRDRSPPGGYVMPPDEHYTQEIPQQPGRGMVNSYDPLGDYGGDGAGGRFNEPPRTGGVTPMPYEPPMQPGGMGGEEFFRELRRKSSNSQPTPPRTGGVTPIPQQAQEYNDIYRSQNSGINGTFDPNKVERERQAREKYGPQPGGGLNQTAVMPPLLAPPPEGIHYDFPNPDGSYGPSPAPAPTKQPASPVGLGGSDMSAYIQKQMEEARNSASARAAQSLASQPAPTRQNADGSFMGPIGGASFTTKTGFNPENKVAGVATPAFYKQGGKVAPKAMAKPASRASAKPAVKGYAKGGTVMASSRGDGIAQRGKTKGRIR